jgi:hypothetical protein
MWFKKKETIFYVSLSYIDNKRNITADRQQYFPEEKTLKEFFVWCQLERQKFETLHVIESSIITNMQFIQK